MVLELGSFASWEDVEACSLDTVIASWLGALLSAGSRGGGAAVLSSSAVAASAAAGRPRRACAEQPIEAIWAALKTVLQRMRVGECGSGEGGLMSRLCI